MASLINHRSAGTLRIAVLPCQRRPYTPGMARKIAQPDVLAHSPDPPPPFTRDARDVLLALIDLWEATGFPQPVTAVAAHLGRPADAVWPLMNVLKIRRFVWYAWPNGAIADGFVPLVLRDQVPDAEPDPVWHRHGTGWSKRD